MAARPAIRDLSRRRRLATILRALGETEVGRELGLSRLANLADFRASVPLMDQASHAARVTARLGFGLDGFDDETLTAATVERPAVLDAWRLRFGGARPPRRIAMLWARADDQLVDQIRLDDLRSLGDAADGAGKETREPAVLRIDAVPRDPEQLLTQLRRFRPEALVVPSLATCSWLEGLLRGPLERRLPGLRWLFAEHDLDERIRSRLPVLSAGWLHAGGRVGLPTRRGPARGLLLATCSTLLELLPHGDPEIDPRARALESTVLPERAVLGERYEVVLSSPLGFLRLRTGLHVRVVGFAAPHEPTAGDAGDSLPRPRVIRLHPPPADAALEGVTLAGAWLTASVRQVFLPEDPALVAADIAADPDALDASGRASRTGLDPFADTELGASRAGDRRKGPKPRALVIRLEVQGHVAPEFPMRIAERTDEALRRRSAAYDWLRGRDELWEPRVVIARPGTARNERERRLRGLWGPAARPVVRMAE
ncbi:MAG: hypothetical protein R6X02_32945 [Enhygromyxa sp.]